MTDQLAELEGRSDDLRREVSSQRRAVESISAERERLILERAKAADDVLKMRDAIRGAEASFAKYKVDYRRSMQARAKGMELGDLTLVDGNFLQKVVVSSATDTELTVLHGHGMTKVPLAKASPAIQALFGFNESIRASTDSDGKRQLDLAIRLGKKAVADNKQRLDEIEKNSRRPPPPYIAPPSSTNEPAWKRTNAFEGSFYAPINKR